MDGFKHGNDLWDFCRGNFVPDISIEVNDTASVSYTHLDVYKRQEYPDIQFLEAYLAVHNHNYVLAEDLLKAIIENQPGQYGAWIALADLYELHLKDKVKAQSALQQAIKIRYTPQWEERLTELGK